MLRFLCMYITTQNTIRSKLITSSLQNHVPIVRYCKRLILSLKSLYNSEQTKLNALLKEELSAGTSYSGERASKCISLDSRT